MESIGKFGGVPSAWHFVVAFYFVFAFVAARFFLDKYIFRVVALFMMSNPLINFNKLVKMLVPAVIMTTDRTCEFYGSIYLTGKKKSEASEASQNYLVDIITLQGTTQLKLNRKTRALTEKCTESMWKLTYYATVEFCILATAYHEPWFKDVKQYFQGWPDHELKLPLRLIYMCQCGFYLYSIAALLMWETRRKDFSVMMSHHIVTVILIAYSYITRYLLLVVAENNEIIVTRIRFFRIGAVILALHDASDVFMEAAKIFKYSKIELGASVCFGLFALSWLVLRLIFFPFWVIRATSYYSYQVLKLSEPYHRGIYYVFNTMLLTLLGFHIYWWKLICAMIIKQLKSKGKVGEDIRSDSEDDDDD
ncbi:hypothetical protein DH2020_029348 [Rehmannia glutinosa]|uniref:TLC domain-containing protein n=1 Tax=Rehmannia glutinosa TaxID=99300 RepID=A0ABR0VNV7_REHGL